MYTLSHTYILNLRECSRRTRNAVFTAMKFDKSSYLSVDALLLQKPYPFHTKPCHIPDKTTLKRKTLPHGTYPYSIDRGVPFPPNTPSPLSAGCTTVTQHLVIVVVHQEMHILIAFKTLLSISAKSMSKYVSLKQLWRRIMAIINTCIWSIYEVKNYFL